MLPLWRRGRDNCLSLLHCNTTQLWRMFLSLRVVSWSMPRSIVLACWKRERANFFQKERWKVVSTLSGGQCRGNEQ